MKSFMVQLTHKLPIAIVLSVIWSHIQSLLSTIYKNTITNPSIRRFTKPGPKMFNASFRSLVLEALLRGGVLSKDGFFYKLFLPNNPNNPSIRILPEFLFLVKIMFNISVNNQRRTGSITNKLATHNYPNEVLVILSVIIWWDRWWMICNIWKIDLRTRRCPKFFQNIITPISLIILVIKISIKNYMLEQGSDKRKSNGSKFPLELKK